jgi:hypothetical protein
MKDSSPSSESLIAAVDPWDQAETLNKNGLAQPWREFWPPKNLDQLSQEELASKPWLTWKRDPNKINDKPWYHWVNDFGPLTENVCQRGDCKHCGGDGCVSLRNTLAYGTWFIALTRM